LVENVYIIFWILEVGIPVLPAFQIQKFWFNLTCLRLGCHKLKNIKIKGIVGAGLFFWAAIRLRNKTN
jgi:hypothetical protein